MIIKPPRFIQILCLAGVMLLLACGKENNEPKEAKDADGYVYETVTIGTQVWFKENLRTTKFRNGDPIETTSPATEDITGYISPVYTWAYEGNETRVEPYGRLYTWYAVNDSRGICPTGWRVPTDDDWNTLIEFVGGSVVGGGKLKAPSTIYWSSPNSGASDEFGFYALPGGFRNPDGVFYGLRQSGIWWSATESSASKAWGRFMHHNEFQVFSDEYSKYFGFSVRCIRN